MLSCPPRRGQRVTTRAGLRPSQYLLLRLGLAAEHSGGIHGIAASLIDKGKLLLGFSIASITSGVLFRGLASGTGSPKPIELEISLLQLTPASRNRVHFQASPLRDPLVATSSYAEGFESGEESSLLLIEAAQEEDEPGFGLIRSSDSAYGPEWEGNVGRAVEVGS